MFNFGSMLSPRRADLAFGALLQGEIKAVGHRAAVFAGTHAVALLSPAK